MESQLMSRTRSTLLIAAMIGPVIVSVMAQDPPLPDVRNASLRQLQDGNYREALAGFRRLVTTATHTGPLLGDDLAHAARCLQELGQSDQLDALLRDTLAAHPEDWYAHWYSAGVLADAPHYGMIVAGEFQRNSRGGGGQWAQSLERDRTQALRWMHQAIQLKADTVPAAHQAKFYRDVARVLQLGRDGQLAWRLQDLTSLDDSPLPDYDIGHGWGQTPGGAPVDADGNPILYTVPQEFAAAQSDGERWRWSLEQIVKHEPTRRASIDLEFAGFLQSQFGVETLQQWGIYLPRVDSDENQDAQQSIFALPTLQDNETIARLANGVKRFELPPEFHFIAIYQRLADDESHVAAEALERLATISLNRMQYSKAANVLRHLRERFPGYHARQNEEQLEQIVDNWGAWQAGTGSDAGEPFTLQYRFRNGDQVSIVAHRLKVDELIQDVKQYIQSRPNELDWQQLQIDNIGWRVVENNEEKYVGDEVASWDVDLKPRVGHLDRLVTVPTPLKEAGAYLVTAKMKDGNVSRVIVWLDDTAIVRKPLDNKLMYYVADATTGKPVSDAEVEFFGWRQERVRSTKRQFKILTRRFAESTNDSGLLEVDASRHPQDHQWIAIARTKQGRFAHLGFSHTWFQTRSQSSYHATRVYAVTDRPIYRPDQPVKFKFWMRDFTYARDNSQRFANKPFMVEIVDPQGTEIFKKTYTTDEFAGLDGEFPLPPDAKLGQYHLRIVRQHGMSGGVSFRVEEYKKPEFEVTVKAPEKPVTLGDTLQATVQARYYFGAPVTNATAKIKVERVPRDDRWFPVAQWDWLYGRGYWWFASDVSWYPGFSRWGLLAPRPSWWHWRPDPPELIFEREVPIGADGTVNVDIDTALAKELHGDEDHEYTITAEVTDASRRTIVGTGSVIAARQPFRVYMWTDRGFYQVGDTITASVQARTPDGKPVSGSGHLTLYRVTYDDEGKPNETEVQSWEVTTDSDGFTKHPLSASEPGQYRLSCTLQDDEGHEIEGGYLFFVRGSGFDGSKFRFNDLELVLEKRDYAPGETARLMLNTNHTNATVLLFLRPVDGVGITLPQVITLTGKSQVIDVPVTMEDMPNFFVEAVTVARGELHTAVREVVVPPSEQVVNVEVLPSAERYQPGEKAQVRIKLTDTEGKPFSGSVVMTMYDRAIEYISGGSNVPEMLEFFWKWKRGHAPRRDTNLGRYFHQILKRDEIPMRSLGLFGHFAIDLETDVENDAFFGEVSWGGGFGVGAMSGLAADGAMPAPASAPMEAAKSRRAAGQAEATVAPKVRTQFADAAYWNAALTPNKRGIVKVSLTMPENLTSWKIRTWALGEGTRVGEGSTEVVTSKNVIVRLQAPRFFVERDEVVLSAVVHNYLESAKDAQVALQLDGETLEPMDGVDLTSVVHIPAGGEARIDWRVKAIAPGDATVTMSARTDEESDAMQMTFPVVVHGAERTESFTGVVRGDDRSALIDFHVPADRQPQQTRFELRYSPTLAGALVDALPYLADYPYGCTEQTLNRFLPTVITQQILQRMGIDLAAIQEKRTNLNAQEIGDDRARAEQWKRFDRNPVFDEAEVAKMVKQGIDDLTAMQLSDGGWGWFSGYGEHSTPHTTAVVVDGLRRAQANDVTLLPNVLERGIEWLKNYQTEQVQLLKEGERRANAPREDDATSKKRYKQQASDVDALVFYTLVEAGHGDEAMQHYLYRDRLQLSAYSQAMLGLAFHSLKATDQRDMVVRNLEQFLVIDDENQTAYIDLPGDRSWWFWHGDSIEANAFYLKLLTRLNPRDTRAAGLVKYLLNNRRHATYWKSTRDTAYCIDALAEYLVASGEAEPNTTVEVWLDGERMQAVEITSENLFDFDNSFVLVGRELTSGNHRLELRASGHGPLYWNAYLTNFSTEDFLTKAGLEIKVERQYYKLVRREDATTTTSGSSGQVIKQQVEKFDRVPLPDLSQVESGDLIEVELEIASKNDYEYLVFEDYKPAGFEPVDLRSGYLSGGLHAYVEYRDQKAAFFVQRLQRGDHSVSYRLRAEIPGRFAALPAQGSAMYAPELRANSDEWRVGIED